jgi:hypothetical protein
MKIIPLVAFVLSFSACASSQPPPEQPPAPPPENLASPPSATAPGTAAEDPSAPSAGGQEEEARDCSRSLALAAPVAEGAECGGKTRVACAEGLTCMAKYRCLDSVGICKKR